MKVEDKEFNTHVFPFCGLDGSLFCRNLCASKAKKYLFRMEEKDMKNNKLIKFGIVLVSVATLGAVAPALTNNPVLGVSIVKAEEQQEPLKFRISFYDKETGEEIAAEMTGIIRPGETINIHRNIDGYEITSK